MSGKFDEIVGTKLPFYGVDNHNFKLGDYVFEAVEDESDGYRSYLGSVEVKDVADLIFFATPVSEVSISRDEEGNFEGYSLTDASGHQWLRFGTENCDDYYPYFVFTYKPKTDGDANGI